MTRMLVPPVRMRDGLPVGCTGATMEDGTVYRADRAGGFDVARDDHVRAMLADPVIGGDVVLAKGVNLRGGGEVCGCGFASFRFSKVCPRCGAAINQPEEATECPT